MTHFELAMALILMVNAALWWLTSRYLIRSRATFLFISLFALTALLWSVVYIVSRASDRPCPNPAQIQQERPRVLL